MNHPIFSIVIPAYNQAPYLGTAIQSVLDQTYRSFEIIVVNDASTDNTNEVVKQFQDSRVRLIVHEKNKGLPAARNTGMRAVCGDFVALLDSDDYFHKEKLAAHYAYLINNPSVDITYNARFELHHSSSTEIRAIYKPPLTIVVSDLLQGFQFSPSDMVLRKRCMDEVGLFDENLVCGGEDLDYPLRLALAGKKFACVDKALNYRRFHSGRQKKKLSCRLNDYSIAINRAFEDSKFPQEYLGLRNVTLAGYYSEVAVVALCQEEYGLGNEILREIQTLELNLLSGFPAPLVKLLMAHAIRDWNSDHEKMLIKIGKNLDNGFQHISDQLVWAINMGYLQKGVQEILWNRLENGMRYLEIAKRRNMIIDRSFLDELIANLILFRSELGTEAATEALISLEESLYKIGGDGVGKYLLGNYAFNNAFALYRAGEYNEVPEELIQAMKYRPGFLCNKGFYAVLIKSLIQSRKS